MCHAHDKFRGLGLIGLEVSRPEVGAGSRTSGVRSLGFRHVGFPTPIIIATPTLGFESAKALGVDFTEFGGQGFGFQVCMLSMEGADSRQDLGV